MARPGADAYLNTRVSLMAARLLASADLEDLLTRKAEDSGELAAAAGISEMLAGDPSDPRVSLEQRLITQLLAEVLVLGRTLTGAERDFVQYWTHRFEVSNLKTIIRGKMSGEPAPAIRAQLVEMGSFATLPLEELLRTEDVAELLRRLETTPYGDLAREAERVFAEQRALFPLDTTFDRRFFLGLVKRAGRMPEGSAAAIRRLVGSIVDRVNLVWLLRYRFAYQLPPAQVFYLLIPAPYRLSPQRLKALAQLSSLEAVLAELPQPFADRVARCTDATQVTRALETETWEVARAILGGSGPALPRLIAYLMLRERDLRRVRGVLRGKALMLSPAAVREALGLDALMAEAA